MSDFRIDSHKLMFHIDRLKKWLDREEIYPIYMEIGPCGACNQRCTFCAFDYLKYKNQFIDTKCLLDFISQAAKSGVKSIMYAGEGEPLLHDNIAKIINYTKDAGIDVALTTNGVLLKKNIIDSILGGIEWIKVSINAGKKKTYAEIHRANPNDFDKVIKNMTYACELKRRKRYDCALGMQLILLPENHKEVQLLAKIAQEIGVDYLVVKPYSQHPLSKTTKYKNIKYRDYLKIAEGLTKYNNKDFNVIVRTDTMKKWDSGGRNYRHCLALPFWAYIDANGNIWGCSAYLGDERFLYGNIHKKTFKEIWEGEKRLKIVKFCREKLDTDSCRFNCRMDEINRYLWELENPPPHVNFI